MSDGELIRCAESALNPQNLGTFHVADVGCAVRSVDGSIFTGACIGGELGICAEQSAVSEMVRRGPPVVAAIVAVWRDEQAVLHVLPPCGRCREFLRSLAPENLDARVILGRDHAVMLRELLPYHGWHAEPA